MPLLLSLTMIIFIELLNWNDEFLGAVSRSPLRLVDRHLQFLT